MQLELASERAKVAKLWERLQAAFAEVETLRAERDAALASAALALAPDAPPPDDFKL
jgi:hypothetical protein